MPGEQLFTDILEQARQLGQSVRVLELPNGNSKGDLNDQCHIIAKLHGPACNRITEGFAIHDFLNNLGLLLTQMVSQD